MKKLTPLVLILALTGCATLLPDHQVSESFRDGRFEVIVLPMSRFSDEAFQTEAMVRRLDLTCLGGYEIEDRRTYPSAYAGLDNVAFSGSCLLTPAPAPGS
jgi:hypothetical protein